MPKYLGSEPKPVSFDFMEGDVFVRPMTSQEKWEIEGRCAIDPDTGRIVNQGEFHAELIAASLVDSYGNAVFTVAELRKVKLGHFNAMFDAVDSFHATGKSKKN